MVRSLDNLANASIQKNDTIKKLIDINKQQQETIHNVQSPNGELLALLKHLSGSSVPDVPTKKTGQKAPLWDPTGYCWTHGYKVKKCTPAKPAKREKKDIRKTPLEATQWAAAKITNTGWQHD
ncbi:hypothetical protein ACHAW6_000146, partial [Cyclotella cf. meneghiniana]